jgi:hypothetical protein
MRFIAIVLSLTSLSAFACPELKGNYNTCRTSNGEIELDYDVVVTQSIVNRATVYSVTSTDSETHERSTLNIIADGVSRTEQVEVPELGVELSVSTQARCSGRNLIVKTITMFAGTELGSTTSKVSKVSGKLHQETTGEFMGETINELVICE